MKVRVLAAVVALLLSACGNAGSSSNHAALTPARGATVSIATTPASSSTGASTATSAEVTQLARYDGYGDMRFGMDAKAFEKAWSGKLADTTPAPGSSCFYRRPMWVKQPRDFAFMFEGGHFVRYEVGTTKEAAPGGGKVGMSEAQIRALYGSNLDDEPHKYTTGAKYLRIKAPQGDGVLLFETGADGKVTRWRVGVPPQIDYVEGCA
jgi:hypothetical protein